MSKKSDILNQTTQERLFREAKKAKKKSPNRHSEEKEAKTKIEEEKKKFFEVRNKTIQAFAKIIDDKDLYENLLKKYLPANTLYLIMCENSNFNLGTIWNMRGWDEEIFQIPEHFSLIDNASESFHFLQQVLFTLLKGKREKLFFDYTNCEQLDIGAQVFLDIIIKDVIEFYEICEKKERLAYTLGIIKDIGLASPENVSLPILKILFSVGSPAVQLKISIPFPDVVPYNLCIYNRKDSDREEQKEIDGTDLITYVKDSLRKVNKTLSEKDQDDLYLIVGETLANAEEHSTVGHRFSIGYFKSETDSDRLCGEFRLVVMNFGKTMYEKFSDPECENPKIVERMREISEKYTKQGFFFKRLFEEETLWTLYALQEGVTSVKPNPDRPRGHGSIQFIKSFFKLKGNDSNAKQTSRMTILSGNTSITFDGTYKIVQKNDDDDSFDCMTFNESGSIRDAPDKEFVKFVDNYFPGTVISARIWLDELD